MMPPTDARTVRSPAWLRCPLLAMFVCLVTGAAHAQHTLQAISEDAYLQHCDVLAVDPESYDARDAYANYLKQWRAIDDTYRVLSEWRSGLTARTWHAWSKELDEADDAFADAITLALPQVMVETDQSYFDSMLQLRPAETQAVSLLRMSREHERALCEWGSSQAFPLTRLPSPLQEACDPITLVRVAEIPLRRTTDTWKHVMQCMHDVEPMVSSLRHAIRIADSSEELRTARDAANEARRTQTFDESRDLIDAVTTIRAEPVRRAHLLRAALLRHAAMIATTLSRDDRVRFGDIVACRFYPFLHEPANDILRLLNQLHQTEQGNDEVIQALADMADAFRAERDAFLQRCEPTLCRATSHDRSVEIQTGVERYRWTQQYIEPDISAYNAMLEAWNTITQRWLEQIEALLGWTPELNTPPEPNPGWVPEIVFSNLQSGWYDTSRSVVSPDELIAIIDASQLNERSRDAAKRAIAQYQRHLAELDKPMLAAVQRDQFDMLVVFEWMEQRYALEQQAIEAIIDVSPEQHRSNIQSAVQSHVRGRTMQAIRSRPGPSRPAWMVDLSLVVRSMSEDLVTAVDLDPLLAEYEREMNTHTSDWASERLQIDRELHELHAKQRELEPALQAVTDTTDPDAVRLFEQYQELRAQSDALYATRSTRVDAITELNKLYSSRIATAFGGRGRDRFERGVAAVNHPPIGATSAVDLVVEHLRNQSPDHGKTEYITAYQRYDAERSRLIAQFARHHAKWMQPDAWAQRAAREAELRAAGDHWMKPREAHAGLDSIHRLIALERSTMIELRAIIGDDIYNDLPPAIRLCFMCYSLDE